MIDMIEKLIETRKKLNASQEDVAEAIGVTRTYMNNIEKRRHVPSVNIFFKWVDALGLKIEITDKNL